MVNIETHTIAASFSFLAVNSHQQRFSLNPPWTPARASLTSHLHVQHSVPSLSPQRSNTVVALGTLLSFIF